jgi:hypothetical protein
VNPPWRPQRRPYNWTDHTTAHSREWSLQSTATGTGTRLDYLYCPVEGNPQWREQRADYLINHYSSLKRMISTKYYYRYTA